MANVVITLQTETDMDVWVARGTIGAGDVGLLLVPVTGEATMLSYICDGAVRWTNYAHDVITGGTAEWGTTTETFGGIYNVVTGLEIQPGKYSIVVAPRSR